MEKILILGGGQSAFYAIDTFRKENKKDCIELISKEQFLPYERPPLSKGLLLNRVEEGEIYFRNKEYFEHNNIKVHLSTFVEYVDFKRSIVFTNDKKKFSYDKLLVATGSTNRKLELFEVDENDVFYLRDLNECYQIKERLKKINQVLIVGAGFIGLEIASVACQLNKKVTVIEATSQVMGRVMPAEIGNLMKNKHEKMGVDFFLETQVKEVKQIQNNYKAFLSNGNEINFDIVIVGIGSSPAIDFIEKESINIDNGIVVNQFCQSSIDNVYAAGDVANFFHPTYNKYIRLESWKHAQDHGIVSGYNLLGGQRAYTEIPWFWSDQYNYNIQLSGMTENFDNKIVRGNNVKEGIIYLYTKNKKIIGACGIGEGHIISKDIKIAGKLAAKKVVINDKFLPNKDFKLQNLLKN